MSRSAPAFDPLGWRRFAAGERARVVLRAAEAGYFAPRSFGDDRKAEAVGEIESLVGRVEDPHEGGLLLWIAAVRRLPSDGFRASPGGTMFKCWRAFAERSAK